MDKKTKPLNANPYHLKKTAMAARSSIGSSLYIVLSD